MTYVAEETTLRARLLEPAGWRLSWGAIIAGIIVALVAHILLNILGMGLGAVAADTSQPPDASTAQDVGIIAGLWWAVSGIIAAGLGGWFAGRAMGGADKDDGTIHGLLSWAATTLVIAFFLTSVLGGALAGALGQIDLRQMMPQAQTQQPAGEPSPAQRAIDEAAKQTTPEQREAARKAVANSALAGFFALALGAIAAALTGRWGVVSARSARAED